MRKPSRAFRDASTLRIPILQCPPLVTRPSAPTIAAQYRPEALPQHLPNCFRERWSRLRRARGAGAPVAGHRPGQRWAFLDLGAGPAGQGEGWRRGTALRRLARDGDAVCLGHGVWCGHVFRCGVRDLAEGCPLPELGDGVVVAGLRRARSRGQSGTMTRPAASRRVKGLRGRPRVSFVNFSRI
jgi:hypothetical protein